MEKPQRDRSRGAVAVEMGLLLPLLILLLTGLFDLGFGAYDQLQADAAAAAGARYAADTTWDVNQIAAIVTAATGTPGVAATPPPSQFCACPTGGSLVPVDCGSACPDGVTPSLYGLVSAQIQYSPIVGYVGLPASMTLTSRAIVRLR
jgi:hypothetical protein